MTEVPKLELEEWFGCGACTIYTAPGPHAVRSALSADFHALLCHHHHFVPAQQARFRFKLGVHCDIYTEPTWFHGQGRCHQKIADPRV